MVYRLRDIVDLAVKRGYLTLDRKIVGHTNNYTDYPYTDIHPDVTYQECGQDGEEEPFIAHIDSKKSCLYIDKPASNLDMILARIKAKRNNKLYGWTNEFQNTNDYTAHFEGPVHTDVEWHTDDDPDY